MVLKFLALPFFFGVRACVVCGMALQEVDVGGGKQCIVIFVPVPMLSMFQKVIKERSLIEELEKKFAGQSIIVIAERRILRKESRNTRQLKQLRPRR